MLCDLLNENGEPKEIYFKAAAAQDLQNFDLNHNSIIVGGIN